MSGRKNEFVPKLHPSTEMMMNIRGKKKRKKKSQARKMYCRSEGRKRVVVQVFVGKPLC
jgi:hypothetical protein